MDREAVKRANEGMRALAYFKTEEGKNTIAYLRKVFPHPDRATSTRSFLDTKPLVQISQRDVVDFLEEAYDKLKSQEQRAKKENV